MRKRVLFIGQLPPPVHGVSLMNERLLKSKRLEEEYDVRVVNITTAKDMETIGKFSLKKLSSFVLTFFSILRQLIFFRPVLIYFTFSPSGFAFYRDTFYMLLLRLFGKKRLVHLHGKGIQASMNKSRLYRFAAKIAFSGAYTIHLSPLLSADTGPLKIKRKFIVYNGIDGGEKDLTRKVEREKTRLLFLSNYVKSKGLLDLVDAIEIVSRQISGFELNLVGKPFDIDIAYLSHYIKEKKLEQCINICGPKYNAEKQQELEEAAIFVFPTYNDAFPLALLEAMQYALPIITTYEGGIPDMIEDGKTGFLVRQRDRKALAEKIIFLISNPEIRKQTGIQAEQAFREKFTFAVFEKNILDTFNEVIEN